MKLIALTIDGQQVSIDKNAKILEAAKMTGINIPTLCYLADLSPEGSCRFCVVEVEGAKTPVTACTYPVSAGIVIPTQLLSGRLAVQLLSYFWQIILRNICPVNVI